jgi:hypothetical protein
MAGGIAFDWRGTPIKEGAKVVTHSKNWNHSIGVVSKVHQWDVSVRMSEHDYYDKSKATLVVPHASLTVLTADLFEAGE